MPIMIKLVPLQKFVSCIIKSMNCFYQKSPHYTVNLIFFMAQFDENPCIELR